ncbi:hypothetical protein SBBP1_730003 [Burkholderiales bacterium]|nr:hypothetical protein SBBP1_730003 [Burkholderiales bacterium]
MSGAPPWLSGGGSEIAAAESPLAGLGRSLPITPSASFVKECIAAAPKRTPRNGTKPRASRRQAAIP